MSLWDLSKLHSLPNTLITTNEQTPTPATLAFPFLDPNTGPVRSFKWLCLPIETIGQLPVGKEAAAGQALSLDHGHTPGPDHWRDHHEGRGKGLSTLILTHTLSADTRGGHPTKKRNSLDSWLYSCSAGKNRLWAERTSQLGSKPSGPGRYLFLRPAKWEHTCRSPSLNPVAWWGYLGLPGFLSALRQGERAPRWRFPGQSLCHGLLSRGRWEYQTCNFPGPGHQSSWHF